MNLGRVDQIAKAVLYEGYMLYPYRPSSVKNRQRWNFGVVYPQAYSEAQEGQEPASMHIECLCQGGSKGTVEVRLRFLHLQEQSIQHSSPAVAGALPEGWQEAVEREVSLPVCALGCISQRPIEHRFAFPWQNHAGEVRRRGREVRGCVELSAIRVGDDRFRVCVQVHNATPMDASVSGRSEALMHSLVSTHIILGIEGGKFISLLEPPDDLRELASQCQNAGAWPVLVGEPGQCDTMLASPIILYDYPQIAPESAGDLFDGTEIDEILSLRIMTLTDEEKEEIRRSDDRARQILERTESMPAEQFMKLHGAVRGMRPLKENA